MPVEHPLVHQLMDSWGIISDLAVHFTPEYLHAVLQWEERDGKMLLHYFARDQKTIEDAITELIGTHMLMLRVLDDCMDQAFSNSPAWLKLRDQLQASVKPSVDKTDQE
ncbi:MAG: hypothetical protein EXR08_05620 [Alphaproteobacteria bacterium]|nr:hypothetical protein [Alphaproteobacteria bacterium]